MVPRETSQAVTLSVSETKELTVDTAIKTLAYHVPELGPILAYKGVWALCTTNKDGDALKATHYASCLISGNRPIWGVWTVAWKFLRFYGSRLDIEEAYPRLVWRRKMATYLLQDITDKSVAARRSELAQVYKKAVPEVEA